MGSTSAALRRLLTDEDPRVQIASYDALAQRGDVSVDSLRIGDDAFMLDVIPSSSSRFVYVKRSGSQRIAVFGGDVKCTPPVFYRSPDGALTITAGGGDQELTVIRVVVPTGTTSPPIPAPLDAVGLIRLLGSKAKVNLDGEVTGVGLDYGAVVRAIHALCESRTLNARFVLEQPNVAELFGPPQPAGRPESEL